MGRQFPTMTDERPVSALAPFQSRIFALLWAGVVLSSIGSWAQTVGAQWLFINDPNAATIISLVQTATALPMVLFALVAGVLATRQGRLGLRSGRTWPR